MAILDTMKDVLIFLGTSGSEVFMIIPALVQTPNNTVKTTSAYAPLVKATQRGLNKLGHSLSVDGKIGPKTDAAAISSISPTWRVLTWGEIFTKLVSKTRESSTPSLTGSAGSFLSGTMMGMPTWMVLAGGAGVLYLLLKKKR